MIMIHVLLPIHFVLGTTPRPQHISFVWIPTRMHIDYLCYMTNRTLKNAVIMGVY